MGIGERGKVLWRFGGVLLAVFGAPTYLSRRNELFNGRVAVRDENVCFLFLMVECQSTAHQTIKQPKSYSTHTFLTLFLINLIVV